MKNAETRVISRISDQRGAAMVTVVLISALLITASVAMLIAVGANSRNTTDVLAETKAYYAAESGLQATINVLRNKMEGDGTSVIYSEAVNNPDLSPWLPYNWPVSSPDRVVIGEAAGTYVPNLGAAYRIAVSDPDNSGTFATFNITGRFHNTYISGSGLTPIVGTCLPSPANCLSVQYGTAPNRTTIFIDAIASQTVAVATDRPAVAAFHVVNESATPSLIEDPLEFEFSYNLTAPQAANVFFRGKITQVAAGGPVTAVFQTRNYSILGGNVHLCDSSSCPPEGPLSFATLNIPTDGTVAYTYAKISAIEPYRLKVIATGYGPNGATKKLEAIIQRNLFNGVGAGGTTTMVGTSTPPPGSLPFLYVPGNSTGVTYSGGSCTSTTGCVPAFVLTDPTNYAYVVSHPPSNGTVSPPPAMVNPSSLPTWQQSPAQLDMLVDQIRTAAQNSGTYYVNPGGNITNPGNYAAGTGVTFCEGSCKVSGDGGGVLVVTGLLTNVGGFNFKGMIIVTGEEGWERTGGGSGSIVGNVVIAPYNMRTYVPENLSSTFLAPRYQISGGGASDVIYGDINATFDNTNGISNFVAGVAEK